MGLFSWLLPNKTLAQATLGANYRAAKAALKRGVSAEEVNECLGYAEHAGLPMVKLLVEHGADVNYKPSDGRTPRLHLAAAFGYIEIAEYLLDQGADINALDKDGDTPLDAAFSSPLDREILALHGVPANPADPAKARRQQAVAALLSSRGGKGGHELPPHLWGPVKSRIEPLVLMAKYNFPQASPDELAGKILEKFDLQFEPGVSAGKRSKVEREVYAAIRSKCDTKLG